MSLLSNKSEPHAIRRSKILINHPDIKKLMGPDEKSKWICLGLVGMQFYLSLIVPSFSTFNYFITLYLVGATLTQALFLAIHETSHNLMFRNTHLNRLFSIFINLPIVIPFAIAFRHYHLDHHKHQGIEGLDTDLPTQFEIKWVQGPIKKFIWMFCQIIMYAVRPLFCGKNQLKITPMLICNILVQFIFDVCVWKIWGSAPLIYMMICVFIAGGLHPCAGHFLSEHYVLQTTDENNIQETFSYYGKLNKLTWNVGYHNEHHDFPYVSGSNLPKIREIAPEYYNTLKICPSWTFTIINYVTCSSLGPHCRVKRKQ